MGGNNSLLLPAGQNNLVGFIPGLYHLKMNSENYFMALISR